eukprot:333780-Prymnesium_polylepis.1
MSLLYPVGSPTRLRRQGLHVRDAQPARRQRDLLHGTVVRVGVGRPGGMAERLAPNRLFLDAA